MLDDARAHGYGPGRAESSSVLGLYGDPSSVQESQLEHHGAAVQIVPCGSALAAWEAVLGHGTDGWLVLVTDRPEEDLGVGVLSHLVGQKLRTPDPWDAVRQQFAATGIEPALYAIPRSRELAQGLLAARSERGWPPAPGGALTRDHALASVARTRLGLDARTPDALAVVQWTTDRDLLARLADLRSQAGDDLADATLDWVCAGAAGAGPVLRTLFRQGKAQDTVPLGLVLGVLLDAGADGQIGLARLTHRWAGVSPTPGQLATLAGAAQQATVAALRDPSRRQQMRALVTSADELLAEADSQHLAGRSDVLPSGLTARLHHVGRELRRFLDGRHTSSLEAAWARAIAHTAARAFLGERPDGRLHPLGAAVRLTRWLAAVAAEDADGTRAPRRLAELARRQSTTDAWVDHALNDAHEGVADPELAEALKEVISAAEAARGRHDREFAEALAIATRDGDGTSDGRLTGADGETVWLIEHVVAKVVAPLARRTPVLLLVLDGMSTGVATEVVGDVVDDSTWSELLLPGATARGAALAVLPTLTEVSRASLLSGELVTGGQDRERKGYAALTDSLALGTSTLFHKKPLDTTQAGFAIADDVAAAIADDSQLLVTCVLNTIDDALDRSDPAGTTWTAEAVKHLGPLLDAAHAAGRLVVVTADHGHVVERRKGAQRHYPDISSGRSRAAEPPAGEDEVLVAGSRVLRHGGRAVLPVNERLRYAPLKAGYHGGAAAAEVVVPLVVLAASEQVAINAGLEPAPVQRPPWWDAALFVGTEQTVELQVPVAPPAAPPRSRKPAQDGPDLFGDMLEPAVAAPRARSTRTLGLGEAVVTSEILASQREVAGRVALSDDQVRSAVEALAAALSHRLPLAALAGAMSLPAGRAAQGAVAQLQSLLNVEGYAVLRLDAGSVVLDMDLMREQFGLRYTM